MRSIVLALCALLALVPATLAGPESTVVVVNGDSWASLTVANEYVALRDIPPGNVVVLRGVTAFDQTSVDRFRVEVLGPVLKAIDERGLKDQIDCITYSVDLPSAIHVGSDMAGKPFPQIITGVASANGLTYLHEWVMKKDADYLRLDINRYSRRTLPLVAGAPLSPAERAEYARGMKLYDEKKYADAAAAIAPLVKVSRNDGSLYYNLACCQSLGGRPDDAMAALHSAVAAGWRNHGQTTSDPDLASLRERPDFKKLIEEMKARPVEVQPTRGFRASYAWDDKGEPAAAGPRYMLSTMLGVTSGRGNSVAEVLACLKRAAAADGTSPRGTIYFEKNGDVRSTTREWAFPYAGDQLRRSGVACITESGILPKEKKDVAGAVIGIADFTWSESGSTILPGAIVEHLTSCGGMMGERDGQTPCTEFIRAGAAGSSGAVTEPFALQEKFPSPFMHLHYAKGSTLAEAFYQSLEGPYQLLIIGDPLCRPWGRQMRVQIPGISTGATLNGKVELKPRLPGAASFSAYVDGKFAGTGAAAISIDTAAFTDGPHVLSVVAVMKDALDSRSRHEVAVKFANTGGSVQFVTKPPARAQYGDKVRVELACDGAIGFDIMHLGRAVVSAEGPQVEVDTTALGTGRVELQTVARCAGGVRVSGPGIRLDIAVPSVKGLSSKNVGGKKGLLLKVGGGREVQVPDTFNPDWIEKAGVKEGEPFELVGWFDVPHADLYQVQLRANGQTTVELDGSPIATGAGWMWKYAPVQLGIGKHRLRVTGKAAKGPRIDVRLGAAGASHPSESKFTCDSAHE